MISKFRLSRLTPNKFSAAASARGLALVPAKLDPSKLNKKSKRKLIRYSLIAGNFILLLTIAGFVFANPSASETIRSSTLNSAVTTADSVTSPLDRLSSAQIALTAAQMTSLPELPAVKQTADSDSLLLSVVPSDTTAISKPQIVATTFKSKEGIRSYKVQSGDTVASIAAKFKVSQDSIRWSNNISGNFVTAGVKLLVPPVSGIVYRVKAGDTPASLAREYRADRRLIITYNDAEISGLKVGERIIIPNGQVVPAATYSSFIASYAPTDNGYNAYVYGYCTWYVANKVSMPSNWGNANTWDDYARLSGWNVKPIPPRAGVIAQADSGFGWLGHVAYVEAVSADRSMIKYSDMNGLAGWGRVGRTADWVSASTFKYIYP
ncbi:MAG: LysM peptidoglycan-binding domain-containing protein [Candidatus Saccharimonadales bacterium]